MQPRLRYFAVLLLSACAIVIGAWPSILTIGALLAIGTGSVALIGVARPSIVDSRAVLRRFTLGGGAVLGLELLLLASWLTITPRRTVHLMVASSSPRVVRVVYGVRDGGGSSAWRWDRYFQADNSELTVIHTRLAPDDGWFRPADPYPVVARTHAGALVPARWIAGGYAHAESCNLAFDEFSIGDVPVEPREPQALLKAGWLDSVSTWGIECRSGQLLLSPKGTTLRRTSPPCYFDREGGVVCGLSPGAS